MTFPIHVIGLPVDGGPLSGETRERILGADLLAGGRRHLARFPEARGEKLPVLSDIESLLDRLAKALKEKRKIVVLATGDPLWFGIGATLVRRFGSEQVMIHPAVSSPQLACARLGFPMADTLVLSRHHDAGASLSRVKTFPRTIILTGGKEGPREIIDDLLVALPDASQWQGWVCQNLGSGEEAIESGPLEALRGKTYQSPNLLVIQNPDPLGLPGGSGTFGRPDNQFIHSAGLITHPEVRAVVLSRLDLDSATVLWDVGAGSGSVGIEAALLKPLLAVHAVEKAPERVRHILENKERFKTANLTVHAGNISDVAASLPAPDRIFVGGGGRGLGEFLEDIYNRLLPGGRLVATSITLESSETLGAFARTRAASCDIIQLQVTRVTPLAGYHKMTPDNPITLFTINRDIP